jgi:hypothetical protein
MAEENGSHCLRPRNSNRWQNISYTVIGTVGARWQNISHTVIRTVGASQGRKVRRVEYGRKAFGVALVCNNGLRPWPYKIVVWSLDYTEMICAMLCSSCENSNNRIDRTTVIGNLDYTATWRLHKCSENSRPFTVSDKCSRQVLCTFRF